MISAIDLSNIAFNPGIQIIHFFKDYKETNPGSQTFFSIPMLEILIFLDVKQLCQLQIIFSLNVKAN